MYLHKWTIYLTQDKHEIIFVGYVSEKELKRRIIRIFKTCT